MEDVFTGGGRANGKSHVFLFSQSLGLMPSQGAFNKQMPLGHQQMFAGRRDRKRVSCDECPSHTVERVDPVGG